MQNKIKMLMIADIWKELRKLMILRELISEILRYKNFKIHCCNNRTGKYVFHFHSAI